MSAIQIGMMLPDSKVEIHQYIYVFFYGFYNIYFVSFAKTQCQNRCLESENKLLDAQVDCQQ